MSLADTLTVAQPNFQLTACLCSKRCEERRGKQLFRWLDNPTAFANGEDLVCLHLGEALDRLCCRPLHFDYIDNVSLPHAEVQAQVSLGHYARPAVYFIHLCVIPS